jgi:hypothetical protein
MLIFDNFIADAHALKNITNSPFWERKSFYWNDALFSDTKRTHGIGEYLVELMMAHPIIAKEYSFERAAGFEYWPTVTTEHSVSEDPDYSLDIHSDFDILRYETTEEVRYPLFGAVIYFGNEDVVGGDLRAWEDNEELCKVVEPKGNRIVVFQSDKPHGITSVKSGTRKSIAINFWEEPVLLPKYTVGD